MQEFKTLHGKEQRENKHIDHCLLDAQYSAHFISSFTVQGQA